MADKKSRKELLKQQDVFVKAAGQSAAWLKLHQRSILLASIAFIVVAIAIWVVYEYFEANDRKASEWYRQALTQLDGDVMAEGANPEATPPTFASDTEKWKTARATFQQAAGVGNSKVKPLADFYIADLDALMGETDAALTAFTDLMKSLGKDDNLYFLAVERRAYLLEKKGEKDAAIEAWQLLAGSSKRFYSDRATYQLARLFHEKDDDKRSRDLLGRFETEFQRSSIQPEVEALRDQLGGQAEETTPPTPPVEQPVEP